MTYKKLNVFQMTSGRLLNTCAVSDYKNYIFVNYIDIFQDISKTEPSVRNRKKSARFKVISYVYRKL